MTTPIPSAALLGSKRLLLVKSTASAIEAELLKATVSKTIVVPAYTRKDGVVVPAHTKVVHYDPSKDVGDVLSGKGSHSQKQAHKKLSKLGHWESLEDSHKLAHILSSATNIQQKASASAAVSGWKASMLAGKKPTASQQAAFDALPADKQAALQAEVGKPVAAPVAAPVTEPVAATPAYQPVPNALGGLGNEGPVIHVDVSDYAAAESALGLEPGSLEGEDSTTYTVKNAAGQTFSVYKHGGGLSVRASGKNTDYSSAQYLADYLTDSGHDLPAALKDPAVAKLHAGMNKPGSWYSDLSAAEKLKWLQANAPAATAAIAADAAADKPLVTGQDGKPKVFYHGGAGHVESGDLKPLTFFTSDKETALSYVGNNSEDEKLHAVHLAIGKLATPEDVKKAANKVGLNGDHVGVDEEYQAGYEYLSPHLNPHVDKVLSELKKQGFDGAHFPTDFKLTGELMPGGSWVVFGDKQVVPADGGHGLQGVNSWEHLSKYKALHPMTITAQAKAWLADNPGKGAELSSTLVDLGQLAIAQKLGIYQPPGFAAAGPKEGDTKPAADGGTLVLKDGHWVKQGGDAPAAKGDVFVLNSQYEKMNAGKWVVYNVSPDGEQVYMHKVGASVPNGKNSATIPVATLQAAIAKGTAKKEAPAASSTLSGYKVTEDVNAVAMVHATTSEEAKASILDGGFFLSNNSMYGKGVYFSDSDYSGSGKYKTSLQVKLKPHKQLVLDSDLEVATALQKITGLSSGHLGSDKAREAFLAAGIGSLRFPVDGETYTVVLDPALIELPKAKVGSATQITAAQKAKLDKIPWDTLLLPAENSNAKSHNAQINKIKGLAYGGDSSGLQALVDKKSGAKQTYAKKQHATAIDALTALTAIEALKEGGAAPEANPLAGMSAAEAIAKHPDMPSLKLKEAWIDANAGKVGAQVEWAQAFNPAPTVVQDPAPANPERLPASQKKMIDDIAKWPDGKYHLKDIANGGNPAAEAYAKQLLAEMEAASAGKPKPPTGIEEHSEAGAYLNDAVYGLEHNDLPTLQDVITALQGDKPAPGSDADKVLQFAKDAYKHVAGAAPAASKPADPTVAELAPMMEAINSAGSEEGAKKAALRYLNAFPGSQLAINQVNDALMMAGYKDLASAHAQKGQPGIENYQPKVAPAAGPIEVKAAVFHHTEDGHNKFWAVSTSGTVVKTTYGKIGSKGQTTEKTFGTVAEADAYAAKIGKEKQGKGYKYAGTTTHEYAAPAPDASAAAVVSKPAKPQFEAGMHDDYQKTANSFESYINDGNVDQLKLHYWSLSSSMDPGTKQLVAYAKAGLESLGVHPAYFAYNLGSKFVPESFKTKKQEMLAAVAAGDKAKVAAMKVGNTFYLKQAKAAYLNAFADLQQDGPKEGDVKQGADGMLVLKDGHWIKMSDKEVTAAVNGWQQAIINESVPTKAQAMVMEHIKSKDENKFLDALHESLPYAMSGDDDGFDDHAEELYVAAMEAHMQALSGGAATPAPAVPAAKDSAAWQLTMKDPSFSGVNTLMADMDGLSVYIAYEPESATFEVGQIHPGADEPEADHFSDPKKALDYLASMYGASVEMPSLGQVEKLTGKVSGATYSPKVPTPDNYVPSSGTGYESMDGWKQTGPQGGSNPGGRFRDEFGVEWYCKFPADEDIAKSEVLAAKLYAALGVSGQDCKLVTKGGKVGIASRWIDVKKGTAAQLAKLDGTASGFAADAWLANHDVVGLAFDNLQIGPDGKAHRVDAGGSLQYRAQGGKKAFGPTVSEIDSLRDPAINAKSAAVFGKMTEADITASVAKVLALPDSAITNLVNQYGPGSDADKLALAQTLIARKADLAKKYPKAAKAPKKRLDPTNLPVDAAMLPKPHDFENWNGPGQGLSSKAHVNKANAAIEYQILGVAQLGNLPMLQAFEYAQIDKETGQPNGKMLPIANHPSKHVVQYHADLVTQLDEMANPPEPLKVFQETEVGTLEQLAACLPPKKFGTTVDSVKSNEKLGFWVVLGVAPSAVKMAPTKFSNFTQEAIAAGHAKFKQGSALAKHFITSVQASGSYNDLFRNGKQKDHSGNLLSDVAKAALAHATTQPEGTSLYRWQKMTDAMVSKIMDAPEGTVFQATGPMCTSYSPTATSHFGNHRVVIRYAKGAKAVESFGSGGFKSEKEVTTLPNSRFVILKRSMVPDVEHGNSSKKRLELEVLMLPPDLGL